ncbi:MAG: chloride channel protein [Oscillospiraceae bacterium]|nr:chloride channel protein [Oscillospiraceae bacterium]
MTEETQQKLRQDLRRIVIFFKWLVCSILSGAVIGSVGTLFFYCMDIATKLREGDPWVIWFLPLAGILIVGIYKVFHNEKDSGTNLVLAAIHSGENLPLQMAPSIFISTVITHLFGGSAGREGAALQLGGSLGAGLGKLFRFDEKDQKIMIMCGMSAAFSALFGTPMAAAIFPMEVVSVGVMYYVALVPCVISSLVAHGIASYFHVAPELFPLKDLPPFSIPNALRVTVLALACAGVSILFCVLLHTVTHLYRKWLKNPYLRVFVGGCLVLGLTFLVQSRDYNGAGMQVIANAVNKGQAMPAAFLLKMIFTALTLGAGYKGGEIVPSFFVGATFGCVLGGLLGLSPTLCAAVGMSAVFCGVTNCPVTSLLISFELFGYGGMPFFLLSIALSYMMSGYFGLYATQRIPYSKFRIEYINRKTH